MSRSRRRIWWILGGAVLASAALAVVGARYALYRLGEVSRTDVPERPAASAPSHEIDSATESEIALFSSKDFSLRAFLEPIAAEDPVEALRACHRWQQHRLSEIEAIPDYSMRLVKQEEVNGRLWPRETILAKIRHHPFSVYTLHVEPRGLRGQEAIYVEGRNDGKMIAHGVGVTGLLGTLRLDLNSALAMKGNRHPITHIGILHMMREEVVDVPNELAWDNFTVRFFFDAKVEGRPATGYEIRHKTPTPECDYLYDQMYFDDEHLVPVRYVRYGWPKAPGAEPHLVEEYLHLDLQFDRGFTDRDFDPSNPEYGY
jgi:hypothetical protein